jgi:hypothetical protein
MLLDIRMSATLLLTKIEVVTVYKERLFSAVTAK